MSFKTHLRAALQDIRAEHLITWSNSGTSVLILEPPDILEQKGVLRLVKYTTYEDFQDRLLKEGFQLIQNDQVYAEWKHRFFKNRHRERPQTTIRSVVTLARRTEEKVDELRRNMLINMDHDDIISDFDEELTESDAHDEFEDSLIPYTHDREFTEIRIETSKMRGIDSRDRDNKIEAKCEDYGQLDDELGLDSTLISSINFKSNKSNDRIREDSAASLFSEPHSAGYQTRGSEVSTS